MMKQATYLILVVLLIFSGKYAALAQKKPVQKVTGTVADSTTMMVLENAIVSIIVPADTSVYKSFFTKENGSFNIEVEIHPFILQISHQGFETWKLFSNQPEKPSIDLGKILLFPITNQLDEVVVKALPVELKGDTVSYNANMFHAKPNATAEDLLKKLPGMEVDKDGAVKAQGESVQRIFVNGKRFFGDDPKMATQNLPADIIDKIEVFDDQSDQSKFTGFDDGNRTKTINLVTKKSRQNGYFGKINVGAGNKGLYEAGLNINKFKGEEQISLIAQINNTNRQMFTTQDILGSMGGGGGRGGAGRGFGNGASSSFVRGVNGSGGNGITNTYAAGLNYRNSLSEKVSIYGSYFYNNLNLVTEQNSLTENLLKGDTSQFNNQKQFSERNNINQRFNINTEIEFDSLNSMTIRGDLSLQHTDAVSQTFTDISKGAGNKLSTTAASTNRNNTGFNGNVNALYKHKFKKQGRTISLNLSAAGNKNDARGNNFSTITDYQNYLVDTINQQFTNDVQGTRFNGSISYTEPIGKNQLLELNYSHAYNLNISDRKTYDYDSISNKWDVANEALTNLFENTYNNDLVTLNYLIRNEKINLSAGSGVQFGNLISFNRTTDSTLEQHYTNLNPTANFRYNIARGKSFRVNYSGRTNQPSVNQLQPVRDESDPTNIKIGNPNLKQQFTHSMRLMFNAFDQEKLTNIFASFNASITNNDIVNSVAILENGVQITQPVNLNGAYNLSGYFNYGFPLKNPKSNLNFATNISHSSNVNLVSGVVNKNLNYTFGETFRFTTNMKETFDLNFSYTPSFNIAQYSVQPDLNETFFSHTISVEPTLYNKTGWILSSDFDLIAFTGRSAGYNTTIPLWNASLTKQVFKNKAGEFRLSVFDLLNQNKSINRTVTENYIQDVQTKVLTRYFLVSFIYNLKSFGKAAKPQVKRLLPGQIPPPLQNMPPPPPFN